jgi:hypothetical protein
MFTVNLPGIPPGCSHKTLADAVVGSFTREQCLTVLSAEPHNELRVDVYIRLHSLEDGY